jgi:CheY-like chemotaxis protein
LWRRTPAYRVSAIALTAFAEEVDREQAFAPGFQWHLAKAIDPQELIKIVSRLVKPVERSAEIDRKI